MSNLTSNSLPSNVVFLPEAADDFRRLDHSRKIKVLKALRKVAVAPLQIGKPLGNQAGRVLVGMRSAYVDSKSVRIIWTVLEDGNIQVVLVAGIAEREGMYVYELVSARRGAVEELKKAMQKSL